MSWNLLYALDALAIALFVLSYYRNCYRDEATGSISGILCAFFRTGLRLRFADKVLNGPILDRDCVAAEAGPEFS